VSTTIRDDVELEIEELRREKDAILLAHYYQHPDIQDMADFVGDSLMLSRKAAQCEQEVIVFCGVRFMAETAKILNPSRTVVLPDLAASCSLVEGSPPAVFKAWRDKYPDHVVVTYVNSSVELKAMSDYTCTSSNALQIIQAIPEDTPIIFAPDRNLGAYLEKTTGRKMRLWNGSCMVHEVFSEKHLVQLKEVHPEALVLAHPECEEAILARADHIGSTQSILNFARESSATQFLIGTEARMIHAMTKQAPGKEFIPIPTTDGCACNECPHMMRNTMEKIRDCLRDLSPAITIEEGLRVRALKPIEAMFRVCDGALPTSE
jgi:quinolinate synthase